jgi:ABC-type multidrug transport system ATPase subunit
MKVVELEGASVVNELGRTVVREVSLTVEAGEAVALIGHNGGGKTTILRLVAGLGLATSGTVRTLGVDLTRASYVERRQHHLAVGFVFELGGLLANRTVYDNVSLPLAYHRADASPRKVDARVRSIAAELGIEGDLETPSFRVNASVRKRALFARALVLEPRLLLCDEPQIGLTPREAARVASAITTRMKQGMTVMFADHDGVLDPYSVDRVLYMENGQILARPSAAPPPDRDDPDRPSVYGAGVVVGGVA